MDVYLHFVEKFKLPSGSYYNAGFENLSIIEIARYIKKITNAKIEYHRKSNDPRSYRQSSKNQEKVDLYQKIQLKLLLMTLLEHL